MSYGLFSLALGFIVYLSLASQMPTLYEFVDTKKEFGDSSIVMGTFNIPITAFDTLIKKHEDEFESWGYLTN